MFILKLIIIGALTLGSIVILLAVVFSIVICIAIGIEDIKLTKNKYYNHGNDNIDKIRKESESNEY